MATYEFSFAQHTHGINGIDALLPNKGDDERFADAANLAGSVAEDKQLAINLFYWLAGGGKYTRDDLGVKPVSAQETLKMMATMFSNAARIHNVDVGMDADSIARCLGYTRAA
jgi:hypothetical protein